MTAALIVLAVVFALASLSKLAGLEFARENFKRWGLSKQQRLAVGIVEVALAILAVIGTGSKTTAAVAAGGALALMAGALRTHIRAHDELKEYVPLIIVVITAIVVLVSI
jgi:uncharacterized membrane protein YphA (DoxX/SURF4 family)